MLNGIRVLDLGSFITAPLAAMILADLDAEVIKVERPEGDPFRRGQGTDYSATFLAFNRNKRSITLDITTAEGRASLLQLIDGADVLIENFRPGFLDKYDLGSDRLRERNPRLIHCSITGFGTSGPYRSRPAFDGVGQALAGLTSLLIDPRQPESFGPTLSDNITAMYAAIGILGALTERARTGRGRLVEVNMLEATMALIQDAFVNFTRHGIAADRYARTQRSQAYVFACRDGLLLALHMSTTEKFWQELVSALQDDSLLHDPRFTTHPLRVKHYHEIKELLAPHFAALSRDEWLERLQGTDVPHAPVNGIPEVLADPQIQALASLWRSRHPVEGEIVGVECPILIDGERPASSLRPPPKLGEHTAEILENLENLENLKNLTSLAAPTGTE